MKEIIGIDAKREGWFGDPSAFYATVEQQGRLALHLHMLLWIRGSLSPQEIRDRLLAPESSFSKQLIAYLESAFSGDFLTGTKTDVENLCETISGLDGVQLPSHSLPQPAPPSCSLKCGLCDRCIVNKNWWLKFKRETDYILCKSNLHDHESGLPEKDKGKGLLGFCGRNRHGTCKARFPRETFTSTSVDCETGHINIKKLEPDMNTFSHIITYLLRCNTDVTCLLSGTAVKRVIAYITDYVSKNPLKTYIVFDTIKAVYNRNRELIGDQSIHRSERARQVMNKIVNALTARSEIGSPMAAMYLLGNPDHYTNHTFITLPWGNL